LLELIYGLMPPKEEGFWLTSSVSTGGLSPFFSNRLAVRAAR
jgi:hypothetical protein